MATKQLSLIEITRMIGANREVCGVIEAVDRQLCQSYTDTALLLFRELTAQEHKNRNQFEALREAYISVGEAAMAYLDSAGVTSAVASVAPIYQNFSFVENAPILLNETFFLLRMGIPLQKINPFWLFVDEHKAETIRKMCEPEFTLKATVRPALHKYGEETGGAEWEHLSPGFWRRAIGWGITVANLTAAVPTCGIAVASVIVGGVGVLAG